MGVRRIWQGGRAHGDCASLCMGIHFGRALGMGEFGFVPRISTLAAASARCFNLASKVRNVVVVAQSVARGRSHPEAGDQKYPSSSMARWTRDAGITGAPGGTGKAGKRLGDFFRGAGVGARERRASFEGTLPRRSPEDCERCMTASYTSSSRVTVVRTLRIMIR